MKLSEEEKFLVAIIAFLAAFVAFCFAANFAYRMYQCGAEVNL